MFGVDAGERAVYDLGGGFDRQIHHRKRTMANVAFIGLGVMGYPMARHLAQRGNHQVTVYNRTGEKAAKWVADFGGRSAPTPKAAAGGADFVFSCVGNDNDLRAVTLGADGCFEGMKAGAIYIDNTTASANIAIELYEAAKKRGLTVLRESQHGVRNATGTLPGMADIMSTQRS